ncbi:MAG: response regulator transcription factor [Verrucomicrobiales bacterium]|nr:response regulator transcription factor [Verrucomicrobiales bacterium]
MLPLNLLWLISQDSTLIQRFRGISETVINLVEDLDRSNGGTPEAIVIDPDGFEVDENVAIINKIREDEGPLPVVVFSDQTGRDLVSALLKVGIDGFIHKSDSGEDLRRSFEALVNGGTPLSPKVAKEVIDLAGNGGKKPLSNHKFKSTELEILNLLSEGKTKRDISAQFNISEHTIDNRIRRIYQKLEVTSLGAAMGKAFRLGIIS